MLRPLAVLVALSRISFAEPPGLTASAPPAPSDSVTASAAPAPSEGRVTVSLQPVLLVMPMIDATVEMQAVPHLGLSARAGYGHTGIPFIAGASFYELGGAANYYVTRAFSGWHVGAELFWMWGDTSGWLFDQQSSSAQMSTDSSAERIAGAYGGYKWIGWHGATALVQLGVGHLDQKRSPDGPISKLIPVANANVGWSF